MDDHRLLGTLAVQVERGDRSLQDIERLEHLARVVEHEREVPTLEVDHKGIGHVSEVRHGRRVGLRHGEHEGEVSAGDRDVVQDPLPLLGLGLTDPDGEERGENRELLQHGFLRRLINRDRRD
jgi:hypothetical protein